MLRNVHVAVITDELIEPVNVRFDPHRIGHFHVFPLVDELIEY